MAWNPTPLEGDEQAKVVEWLDLRRVRYFSVPNEAKRSWQLIKKLKLQGLKAGVPDLIFITPAPCDGLPVALEMKRVKGSKTSDDQKAQHVIFTSQGWHMLIALGARSAIEQLRALGY